MSQYTYIIKRRANDNARWEVGLALTGNPSRPPVPGDDLTWAFDIDDRYEGLEAHFQFCHFVLERALDHGKPREVCFVESDQINQDWAASIPNSQSTEALTGTLRPGVPQAKAMHYAVWIVDPKGINDFAIGENPPPQVDTGP